MLFRSPDTKPALFITGPPGIGKTTIANCILKEFGYDVIEFNSSDVRSQKIIKEKLTKILNTNNISKLIDDNNKIKGVIMDEIDGMSGGDRGGLNEIIDLLSPLKKKGRKKKKYN